MTLAQILSLLVGLTPAALAELEKLEPAIASTAQALYDTVNGALQKKAMTAATVQEDANAAADVLELAKFGPAK